MKIRTQIKRFENVYTYSLPFLIVFTCYSLNFFSCIYHHGPMYILFSVIRSIEDLNLSMGVQLVSRCVL